VVKTGEGWSRTVLYGIETNHDTQANALTQPNVEHTNETAEKHHPTGATNRPGNVISPSLSQPEDTFPRTASHSGSPPPPVIGLPSNDGEAIDDDIGPYHAISMTPIQSQSSYGSFIQKPSSERPCPTSGRPTTHRAATAVDGKDSCKLDDSTPSLIWNMGLAK